MPARRNPAHGHSGQNMQKKKGGIEGKKVFFGIFIFLATSQVAQETYVLNVNSL